MAPVIHAASHPQPHKGSSMKIVLVGPGALGCLLASQLAAASGPDHSIALLDHDGERAARLCARGISCEQDGQKRLTMIPVLGSAAEAGEAEVVISCVKSYDIPASLAFCRPLFGAQTLIIFMQNGIAHLDLGRATLPATPVYATTTEGATRLGPGMVRHAGRGLTQFGFLGPVSADAQERLHHMVELFDRAGLSASISGRILSRIWTKLLINVGINGLTAVLDCANGDLVGHPQAAPRMARLVAEGSEVARRAGVEVPADALQRTLEVCSATDANISSMLQDVRAHRQTEIDAINGSVAAAGRRLGVATPENDLLVRQVKKIESTYINTSETSP